MYLFIYLFSEDDFNKHETIPIGGDQLVRVRLDAAKGLCAGAHTKQDRLEVFNPVLEEFFHVTQDYVHVSCLNTGK